MTIFNKFLLTIDNFLINKGSKGIEEDKSSLNFKGKGFCIVKIIFQVKSINIKVLTKLNSKLHKKCSIQPK